MNNSYILLRNNIESTSLSFEELKKIGLETSDLVWVECQSVFWQSPMEIAELKSLVRKNEKDGKKNESPEHLKRNIQNQQSESINKKESKSIFIEMPASQTDIDKKQMAKSLSDEEANYLNKYSNPGNSGNSSTAKKVFELNTRYSKLQNTVKENAKAEPVQKPVMQSGNANFYLPAQAKKIALYLGLFAAGAVTMLIINNAGKKNNVVVQENNTKPAIVASQMEALPSDTVEYNSEVPENYEQESLPTGDFIEQPVQQPRLKTTINKKLPVGNDAEDTAMTEIMKDKNTPQKQTTNLARTTKPILAENIIPLLSIKANEYKVGSFGGIRNLEMTLQNDSEFPLDKVAVEIEYLNPEGNMVNSDKIFFQSLQPGDVATIPVQKSKRGVKISYKIIKIEAKAIASDKSREGDSNNYSKN